MHHSNAEWFWNSATNNHLSMHCASNMSSNGIITDFGICVGMRNVKLQGESTCLMNNIPHYCEYSIPRPLVPQNWYNNYAQHLHRNETFAKYYAPPVIVPNGLNALVVNEYSSNNMRDEILKFRQSLSTNELIQPTSSPAAVVKDDILDPSLAPPKKKWIRHYMMGEYNLHNLNLRL